MKMVLDILRWPGPVSVWGLVTSWIYSAGTTSEGIEAPSATPLTMDSGTRGVGIWIGVAPSEASTRVPMRVGAYLEALEAFEGFDQLAGEMQFGAVMDMGHEDARALELVQRIFLQVFPEGTAAAFGGLGREGQLEDLGFDEASGLAGRYGPYDVGDVVLGLVEELRRRVAQLHGRVELAFDAVGGLLGDLLAPRAEQQLLRGGVG